MRRIIGNFLFLFCYFRERGENSHFCFCPLERASLYDVIQPIGLPLDLSSITSGQAFTWEEDTAFGPYEVAAELTKDSESSSSWYNTGVDYATKSIVFYDVPVGEN